MYSDLGDFININGLKSITVLFNVLFRWMGEDWEPLEHSEGLELLKKIQKEHDFFIEEVNRTHWVTQFETMADSHYSVYLTEKDFYDFEKLKKIIYFLNELRKKYQTPQIFINNIFEVDGKGRSLIDYLEKLKNNNQYVHY